MLPNQKDIFINKMRGYFEKKRDEKISDHKLEWYWECLLDYEIKDISMALAIHDKDPRRGSYLPKPADIIAKISKKIESCPSQCQFSMIGRFEKKCEKNGEVSYGREIFRPSPSPAVWDGDKFFDLFETNFWSGNRVICVDHFYFAKNCSWAKKEGTPLGEGGEDNKTSPRAQDLATIDF
jgi:hypothetical protein